MLARLQRLTTFTLLAAALGWAIAFASRPSLAAAGAVLIVMAYALFLAVEFVVVAVLKGHEPAPRPRLGELLRAWAAEVWFAPQVFCWRQPFRSRAEPDHLPNQAHGRRGVLFVHGFVCNRGLWNPWLRRLRAAGVPFAAVNLEPVFGPIDAYPAVIDAAVRRLEAVTGVAPVIVAHSMGGLAVRAWLDACAAHARVHRIVTIGTPHHGTWLARFALVPNARQMRLSNPWLLALARREPPDLAQRFTCFFSHCDNIVMPARTATLAGADNRHLAATAHVHMVASAEVAREVDRWLGSETRIPQA